MAQYALLVGVGNFRNKLPIVDYVKEDVHGFSDVLMNNMDVPFENIVEFLNEDATQDAIESEVEAICGKVNEGDRVILYFSTHGKTFCGTSFLAAFDASDDNNCNDGWIWVSNIITSLHNARCNVLAFLDACHSTQFSRAHGPSPELIPITPIGDVPGQYKALFGAAGEHEEAYSDLYFNHGCWTFYLIEALSGRAPRALSDGSRRITANSLQTYLCESVSARQRELGRKQTPYIDAVYPSDILIVEFPETEERMMKVKDIYFGEIDTDSEKSNVPSTEFMVKNFYDLNSISSRLNTNNGIQVIIGNKGTGKTYLGEYLEVSNDNAIFETVKTISLADIQNLTSAQADERGKYVQAWTFALYSVLACLIVNQKRPGADDFHALLKEIYGNQLDLILQSFSAGKRLLLNKKLKRGIKLSDLYGFSEDDIVHIDQINLVYTMLFNKHYSSQKLYFLIDGLDEHIRGRVAKEHEKYILDLFGAVDQSHDALTGVRIILLFRNDLLHMISGEANLNKIITARSCTLSWLSTTPNYAETPLYQFLEKRIATSAENAGSDFPVKLEDILPPQIQADNTWEWILRLTTYTPRDIISFFKKCQEFCGERNVLTIDNLWDATRPYSDYLWKEFRDVLAGTVLAGRDEQLESLFTKLVQTYDLKRNTRFDFAAFLSVYQNISGLGDIPISETMKILYETGMMCVHTNSGTYWYFRENPLPYDYETWKGSIFEIHTGLWKKFHIW